MSAAQNVSMIEFYPAVRLVHIYAVTLSGGLFFVRGLLMLNPFSRSHRRWALAAPVRYVSYGIDTVLLTAALMLSSILRQYPFIHAWLTVKVLLLILYILLGYQAFWRDGGNSLATGFWVAALATYLFIVTVARSHHPLGLFQHWL